MFRIKIIHPNGKVTQKKRKGTHAQKIFVDEFLSLESTKNVKITVQPITSETKN